MRNKLFIMNLQRLYSFEVGATEIYQVMSSHTKDAEIRDFLLKFRDIEQTHVDFWEKTLRQYGVEPLKIGGSLFALGASTAMHGIGFMNIPWMLRVASYVEVMALKDYSFFIERYKTHHPELVENMWNLKAEEELHGLWLKEKSEQLIYARKNLF